MKKIGILFGMENSFPWAFIERVNQKTGGNDIMAEPVRIDKVIQGEATGYAVVIDRISQDVPFYRGWLKNEALSGCAVVNNPFWWSADEKFFNNALATRIGVQVPKTVLLPSHSMPPGTSADSFRNLAYPLDWDAMFNYIGWPAFFKPFAGGGWKNVYRLHNPEEFYRAYAETGELVMMLQEEVKFDMYFRCYSIDQRAVRVMPYEPRNPYHLRYRTEWNAPKNIVEAVEWGVLQLNQYLGYDLNTVEFAIRDGVPLAIDFCNPAPDAEYNSVGHDNFEWVVDAVFDMAIRKAREHVEGRDNLSWGKFMQAAVSRRELRELA
ncbi:MAG: RimK family alpha-L-glutamate ligase [Chthoniobacterales bacterium]